MVAQGKFGCIDCGSLPFQWLADREIQFGSALNVGLHWHTCRRKGRLPSSGHWPLVWTDLKQDAFADGVAVPHRR